MLAGTCRPVLCPLSSAVDRPACQLPCAGRDPRLVRAAVERAPHPCVSLSHSSVGVHNPAPYATLVVRVVVPPFCPPNDLIPIDVFGTVPVHCGQCHGRRSVWVWSIDVRRWPVAQSHGGRRSTQAHFRRSQAVHRSKIRAQSHTSRASAEQDQCKYHVPYVQFENFRNRGAPRAGARTHNRLNGHCGQGRQTAFSGQAAGAYAKTPT